MKLDDEIVELGEWDAVRVPPGTWRGYEAGPDGLEILVRQGAKSFEIWTGLEPPLEAMEQAVRPPSAR